MQNYRKSSAVMYVGWNNSDCYFPLKKCLARSILFAASVVKFQHFCNHDTVFNLSDELWAGCDSKDELHVIICSEETPKPKKKKTASFFVAKEKLQHNFCYLHFSICFLLPFHCSSLSLRMLFLSFTYDIRLISSWKARQEYWNPTLCSVAMTEKWTLSSRKVKENIFLIFNSHLHRPHQTNKVCFSPPRLPDDDFDAQKNIPSGSLLFPFS